jgi:hypothetical protein
MDKIDLIIDALELAAETSEFERINTLYKQALAAARELRELTPVGMASKHIYRGAALFDGVVLPEETLLYALDEVTK